MSEQPVVIKPESKEEPVTFQLHVRQLDVYPVTDAELDTVAGGMQSVHFGFFGLAFGALVSFAITIATVPLGKEKPIFVALTAVSLMFTSYFGIHASGDYRKAKTVLAAIKKKSGISHPPST